MFDKHFPTHRVLIVDDEFVPRSIESFALEGTGRYYAMEAGNGVDALTMLSCDSIDCAVIDSSMPDMSGAELVARIRRNIDYRDLPIVLVLDEDEVEGIDRASTNGPTETITRPFDPWQLASLLDGLTGSTGGEGHILSVEAVLRGFPYPTMILDAEHNVLLANGIFYQATKTGVGTCFISCQDHLHADRLVPSNCPLDRCAKSGDPAEEFIDTTLGGMRVSVYPLAIRTGDERQLYLHVTQPSSE